MYTIVKNMLYSEGVLLIFVLYVSKAMDFNEDIRKKSTLHLENNVFSQRSNL